MSARQHVVALLSRDRVAVVENGGVIRLPRVASDDDLPDHRLLNQVGGTEAMPVVPARLVGETPRTLLHVLAATRPEPGETRAELVAGPLATLGVDELARLDDPEPIRTALATGIAEHRQFERRPVGRPPWFADSWLAEADEWIDARLGEAGLRRTDRSEVVKIWSLSAVLRIPCTNGHTVEAAYLKACSPWFAAEPMITALLARLVGDHVPEVIAVDSERAWQLMHPLPQATAQPVRAATTMAELQVVMADRLGDLGAAGAPDRRLAATLAGLAVVLESSLELPLLTPAEQVAARGLEPWLSDQMHALADLSLPYSIGHGDLHVGNVAADGDRAVIYDWSDAAVTFPTLDAVLLADSADTERDAVLEAYADVWRRGYADSDVRRALTMSGAVTDVYQAISYEGIYRAQEPDSRWELAGVVARILRRLIARSANG